MTHLIKMKQVRKRIFIRNEIMSSIWLLLLLMLSCVSTGQTEKVTFLDQPFDFESSLVLNTGGEEYYYSSTLDSLIGVEHGHYIIPDVVGTTFEEYAVSVVSCLNKDKKILLFYDNNRILRDTIILTLKESFSLDAVLAQRKKGICVGVYSEESNYLRIERIYELNESLKLKKVIKKNIVSDCRLPQEYLTEENPFLSESFSFGIDGPEIKNIKLLQGKWQPDCEEPSGYFRIKDEIVEIELRIGEVGAWMIFLDMKNGESLNEVLLFFNRTNYVSLPMGSEGTYDSPPSDKEISSKKVVGKLKLISGSKFQLIWYGLYHMASLEVLDEYDVTFVRDAQGSILLKVCE